MARDFNVYNLARVAEYGTRPLYAIELDFSTPYRVTSWDQDITWNGLTFLSTGVKVSGLDHNEVAASVKITIPEDVSVILGWIVAQGLEQAAKIWKFWADSPTKTAFAVTDAEAIFDGIISSAPNVSNVTIFNLKPRVRNRMAPFIRLGKPVNNWNIQPGVIIRWSSFKINIIAR